MLSIMARLARIVVPGQPHHITHRGNRRADVFIKPGDQELYKTLLQKYAVKAKMDIWAYCLMSNHVHLLVVPHREDSLAKGVGLAHRRYAVLLNQREGWSGHLWANRYFSTPLDDSHLWACARYIERNPLGAKLVDSPAKYPWSSALAHAEGKLDSLLSVDSPFPGPVEDWLDWLSEPGDAVQLERIRRCTKTGRPCGGDNFIDWLEEKFARIFRPLPTGRKPLSAQSNDKQIDMLDTQ